MNEIINEHLKNQETINSFKGKYFFLSNFYVFKNGLSSEHLYQSMKTKSKLWKVKILSAKTPSDAKKHGKLAPITEDWKIIKIPSMEIVVRSKFFLYSKLKKKLMKTEDAYLIEGNQYHDNFWGDCKCEKCKDILGLNYLGLILMEIRRELFELYGEKK